MTKIFPGKTAVCVSSPYGKEHSCKKSKKSLGRLSGKIVPYPTNQLPDNYSPNLNWRWELQRHLHDLLNVRNDSKQQESTQNFRK